MAAAESSGVETYPIKPFLDYIHGRKEDVRDAAARGCVGVRDTGILAVATVVARQWARCYHVEVGDIWPDGPLSATAPVLCGMERLAISQDMLGIAPETVQPSVMETVASQQEGDGGTAEPVSRKKALREGYERCPVCEVPKRAKLNLPSHIRSAHPDYVPTGETPAEEGGPSPADDDRVPCPDPSCPARPQRKIGLANHIHLHHGDQAVALLAKAGLPPKDRPKPNRAGGRVTGANGERISVRHGPPSSPLAQLIETGAARQALVRERRLRYLDLLLETAKAADGPVFADVLDRIERQLAALDQ